MNCFLREDLIKYYDQLSREMEYREFRAQWRIRRSQLNAARTEFLAREQARLDILKDQMAQASGSQTPATTTGSQTPAATTDLSDARPAREVEVKPATVSEEEKASTPVSVPSPSLVSLIASGVKTDALLRSEQQKNAVGSKENEAGISNESLSSEISATDNRARKTWDSPDESAAQLEKLKGEGTQRKTWETPDGELKIASSLPKSHPSDSSIQFAMYSDKRKSGGEEQAPDSGITLGNTYKTSAPRVADSSLQDLLYPSTPSVETSGLDALASSFVTQPSESDAGGLVMGHPSVSSAQDLLYGSGAPEVPAEAKTPFTQGHPSDSSAQHLMYSSGALEGASADARFSEHGHPSDSSVSGLLYPSSVDTPTRLSPRLSQHGHPSDSQVSLSQENAKGPNTAQVLYLSSRSTWQHPSDASVQKLLGNITMLGESQQTTRGTPPPSVAQDILYPSQDPQSTSFVSQTRGTPPQSVAQDILYPSGEDSGQIPGAVHTRGAPPSSVIQDIMYPSGEGTAGEVTRVSTRGQEPEVKITKIMYYVKDNGGKAYVHEYALIWGVLGGVKIVPLIRLYF